MASSSLEASDSLVFLYKFVEHEAKINIEICLRIQKSDQTGDWTQAFWTYTRCSNHWAIQPCWVQSYNELYVSAAPNYGY